MFTVVVIVLFALVFGIVIFGKPNLDEGVGCAVRPLLWMILALFVAGLLLSIARALG